MAVPSRKKKRYIILIKKEEEKKIFPSPYYEAQMKSQVFLSKNKITETSNNDQ